MREVVDAAPRRRRSGRRRSGRSPRSRAYSRSAVHSRSNRTWSATLAAGALPVVDPVGVRLPERVELARRTRASGLREEAAPGGERRRRRVRRADARRAGRAAAPATSSGRRPASQSTNGRPRRPAVPPGSDVGCSTIPLDRRSFICLPFLPLAESLGNVPFTLHQTAAPPASRSRTSGRRSTADAIPSRGRRAIVSRSRRTSSRTVTTCCARSSATGPRARGSGWSSRSSRSGTIAGPGSFERHASWAAGSSRSRRGSIATRRCLDELDRKLAAGQVDLASELAEGELLFGAGELDDWHAAAPALGAKDRHGKASLEHRSRSTSSASGRASAPGTSSSRARGAGSRASRRCCPQLAELGFDVLYLPPVHPIGTTNRKGRNNALVAPRRAIPGARGRSAGPEGGHDAIHPELGTWKDFDRLVEAGRKHGRRDRARLRDPVLARPPVARAASGVVQPAAGRDAQVRGEPAQALPGHLQRQLRLGGLARPLGGAPRRRSPLVPARRPRLPRRQPAHEVGPVLGVADRRGARRVPRRDLPRRGLHAPGDDDDAGEDRLQPVVHLLHLEEHEGRAQGVPRAPARLGAVLPAELLREHAGHPARVPAAGRAAGVPGAARAGRDALAVVRDLLGLRELRERARCGRERGVPRLGEVRGQAARARRAAAAARAAAERDPARGAGAAALREPAPARHARRARLRVRQGHRDRCRRQSRSAPPARGRRRRPARTRPARRVPGARPPHRRALPLADRPQLRRAFATTARVPTC